MIATIDAVPHQDWVREPSPLQRQEALARDLGMRELWVKRDDLLPRFGGGNKVRKLNLIAPSPPTRDRQQWHATGAIGSGHLRATAMVARATGHELIAHAFGQPLSPRVLQNLADTAVHAAEVHWYPTRVHLAARRPQLFFSEEFRGGAVIPPGGTSPAGTAAFVFAAWELIEQLAARGQDVPPRIYLPLGSGGAAAGLALGLALARVPCEVRAIAIVERWLVPPGRLRWLQRSCLRWLAAQGLDVPSRIATQIHVDHSQLGAGYGVATSAARAATSRCLREGMAMEPVYSGKAMAALMRDAAARPGSRALFWLTCYGGESQALSPDWKERLPEALQAVVARG